MIKAILMDVDDTIFDFKKCSHKAILDAADTLNIFLPTGFLSSFDVINQGLWETVERGEMTVQELFDVRFMKVFKANKVHGDPHAFETVFHKNLDSSHEEVEGARELIEYLHKKYKLYIASNSNLAQQENRLRLAGLYDYFDGMFVSEELGYMKPSREFFYTALSKIGLLHHEVIMIGDSITSDIKGAEDYGMFSIWYNPDGKTDPLNIHDFEVSSLLEIKKMI